MTRRHPLRTIAPACCSGILLLTHTACSGDATSVEATQTTGIHAMQETPSTSESEPQPQPQQTAQMTGYVRLAPEAQVWVHFDERYVDVPAIVVGKDVDWLELIACMTGGRQHEALVAVPEAPRYIHAGLMALGVEPGEPVTREPNPDGSATPITEPAHGPLVAVYFVMLDEQGEPTGEEIPVNEWVKRRDSDETLASNEFMFTGSFMGEIVRPTPDGGELRHEAYWADVTGNIISLVNFGDEVFAMQTDATDRDGNEYYDAYPGRVPDFETPIILRFRPVDDE